MNSSTGGFAALGHFVPGYREISRRGFARVLQLKGTPKRGDGGRFWHAGIVNSSLPRYLVFTVESTNSKNQPLFSRAEQLEYRLPTQTSPPTPHTPPLS
jgi:hypothetical protein